MERYIFLFPMYILLCLTVCESHTIQLNLNIHLYKVQNKTVDPQARMLHKGHNDDFEDLNHIETNELPTGNAVESLATNDQTSTYPENEIESYLKMNPQFDMYFSRSHPQHYDKFTQFDSDETENLCEVTINRGYTPRKLKNIEGIERTIVNQPGYYQLVHREICKSELSNKCESKVEIFGYTSLCVQEYSQVRLFIYNSSQDTGPSTDLFKVESCCSCKLQKRKKWKNSER